MKKEDLKISPEEFNKILENLHLQGINLVKSSSEIKVSPQSLTQIDSELTIDVDFRSEDRALLAFAIFKLVGKVNKRQVLLVSATFQLDFSCELAMPPEEFYPPFKPSVEVLARPFAREFFATMTSRMGLPPFLIPIIISKI